MIFHKAQHTVVDVLAVVVPNLVDLPGAGAYPLA